MRWTRHIGWGFLAWVLFGAPEVVADPTALLDEIRSSRLDAERAVAVRNLNLSAGMARFEIREGVLFPATTVGGRVVEMVFQGRARWVLEPPDEIEAGQLELFTGHRSVDETVTEAVIAVGLDAASDNIAGRPPATGIEAETVRRAHEIFDRWKERPERRLLGVETAVLRDALGDPVYAGYFAGWFRGDELGQFLYLFEPDAREQISLGQFTLLDATEKEKRKLARTLHREQRRGRLIGRAVEDLGAWDTWLSASRRDGDGRALPGARDFEPRHYVLDVSLVGSSLEVRGLARIDLECLTGVGRAVKLELHSDLVVTRVREEEGPELFFHQTGEEILVALPRTPARGETIAIEIEYSGQVIDRIDSKSFALANTTHWYPHAGTVDLAPYDVTFHWPQKLDLMAGGELIESGREAGGMRFERRRLDKPTFGFSFEIGKFQTLSQRAGHVEVTLAFDTLAASVLEKNSRESLLTTITDSLLYFEALFGPYPLDELTVVTAGRGFSQSFLGFITLANLSLLDVDWMTLALGLEDRRTVVAHEVAHQWWGHLVGWKSYRDQWISEAMANYSAVLYARHRLRDGLAMLLGPTAGWQAVLTGLTEDGRRIESVGPLVLGERLVSSRSAEAYQAVVYQKGAIVLGMLARIFGEETFLGMLRQLVEVVAFQPISTEEFLSSIERLAGVELDSFARQFVYATGLPEIYYNYEFTPAAAGKWRVHGIARQQSPYRYAYRVVATGAGGLDIARQRLDQIEASESVLVAPFQIAVFNPAGRQEHDAGLELDPLQVGNGLLQGNLLLSGESTEIDFEIDYEPKELWLDRGQEVFGLFFNERRFPKRVLYLRGLDLAAAGDSDEAEKLFQRALAADALVGPTYGVADQSSFVEATQRHLDAMIWLDLTQFYLDQARLIEAERALERLRKLTNGPLRSLFASQLKMAEGRLALQQGEPGRAFRLLRKARSTSPEGLLLLAIAARLTGHQDEYRTAARAASAKGADVALLGVEPSR